MNSNQTTNPYEAQKAYVQKLESDGHDYGLIIGETFVQSMREQGYRSTARAINELIDNAMEAQARNIYVVGGLGAKDVLERYAVVDDGHGMEPSMIRASVLWGGTHRANSRTGIGRFGFGLPTSCVSQGRRFTVYSRTQKGPWHCVTIDLDDIAAGNAQILNGRIIVPESTETELPSWIIKGDGTHFEDILDSGTVVVVEKLDRLKPSKWSALERDLLQFFGITYRNFLRDCAIFVSDKKVLAVDPLFLTPGAKDYELPDNPHQAIGFPDKSFTVETTDGRPAVIRVRCSILPPGFATRTGKWGKGNGRNARFGVLKENHGLLILRNGRQMDTILSPSLFPENHEVSFQNNDRFWKVEIDFSAELDEEFGVTTNKQQVRLSDRMWQVLASEKCGLFSIIESLRKESNKLIKEAAANAEDKAETDPDEPRPSEQAMAEGQKFRRKPQPESQEQQERRQRKLQEEIDRLAETTGLPREQIAAKQVADTYERPYKVLTEDTPGGPFFRVDVFGPQNRLFINKAHPFYTDVYAHEETKPRFRFALEIMLFVIGEGEVNANQELQMFYQSERPEWSNRLRNLLPLLQDIRRDFEVEEEVVDDEESVPV